MPRDCAVLLLLAGCASAPPRAPLTVVGLSVFVERPAQVVEAPRVTGVALAAAALPAAIASELGRLGLSIVVDDTQPHDVVASVALDLKICGHSTPVSSAAVHDRCNGRVTLAFAPRQGKAGSAQFDFDDEEPDHIAAAAAAPLARALVQSEEVLAYSVGPRPPLEAARKSAAPARTGARIAVLDVRSHVPDADVVYLSDQIRSLAFRALPAAQLLTRENILVLLAASGRKIEDCDAECEVETGRRLGADLIISGDLHLIGKSYRLNLRIHETKTASLIGVAGAQGAGLEQLDAGLPAAVSELLKPLQ